MNNKPGKWSAAFGITFVWFTTQFGGGFASGAQLKSYFIKYGVYCLWTCIGAQVICAIYNWYIARYARKHELYDYKSYNDTFYGKYSLIFSNLFEIVYIFTLLVVPAVAFATGGATFAQLTGIPYMVCTAIIGVFIFVTAVYGTAVVRKVATILSIAIVVGLLAVFVPNIIVQWDKVMEGIATLKSQDASAGPAIWSMILYAAFQFASSPAIHSQHSEALGDYKDADFTYILACIVNSVMIFISTLGLMAIINNPEYADASVPVLILVQNGVGASVLTPIISALIVLGAVSTAVNMISAGEARIMKVIDKSFDTDGKPTRNSILVTLVLTLVGFFVAQFGLLPLVSKGYSILAYLAFPVIAVPYIIHAVVTKFDSEKGIEKREVAESRV
ncbi:hypothetical protein BXO88_06860 [Oribacterium sp. C9]|uniref:YkvI family membrane protein n=1 Tax=Oribacterium sp. C9 TaxID=1943579 RepID=UPI00098F7397|nr:hypothetical protein [Oribacterium sp. C9]OON86706.1 hypothetical protein BXO88_06860 [Oribacterium sp. C9]